MNFQNNTILVTGGTGSFGQKFIENLLSKHKPKKVIVYSRDELKQSLMQEKFKDKRLRFFLGDVRDISRLKLATREVDILVHSAALKQVPAAEYNPTECIKTNIDGAKNIIAASIENKLKKVIALSTDKAVAPINLYGATKLASDKLFVAGNLSFSEQHTEFSVVRYGNVMGSRGSVIPFFMSLKDTHSLPITDTRMTRFMISLEQAVKLVWHAFTDMRGGEIYVKKIPSMNILDIASAVSPESSHHIIGIRPGEKLHEQMIGSEDAPYTFEYKEYFKILPMINELYTDKNRIMDGKKVPDDFSYASNTNKDWMSICELKEWLTSSYSTSQNA